MSCLNIAIPYGSIRTRIEIPKHQKELLNFFIRDIVSVSYCPLYSLKLLLYASVGSSNYSRQGLKMLLNELLHVNYEVVEFESELINNTRVRVFYVELITILRYFRRLEGFNEFDSLFTLISFSLRS